MTQNFGGIANNNRIWGNILRDYAARTDNGILTNAGVGEDRGSGSDRCSFLHDRALHLPVALGLQFPLLCSRAWIAVIDEGDAMPDEHVVFDRYTLTDEGVARYLAASAYVCIFLNLDKSPDFGFIADLTAVEIDELGEFHASAQFHVRGYTNMLA